ncbi:MAG: hypothetical protein EOO88_33770 [Pedobacter sp.]|nr:MAG: hypothetical protein EOO88_33770 [Pedobacter sp.]
MGKFDGKFIKGLVGKSIFREYRGQQIIQGVSRNKVKQHAHSKAASAVFGTSSKLGSYIRAGLDGLITNNYDGGMSARFNGDLLFALRSALVKETQTFDFKSNSFNRLAGFEFNIHSPLKNNFFAQPTLSIDGGLLKIDIPEMHLPQDVKFPHAIQYCKMIVGTALFDLTNGYYRDAEYEVLDFKYQNEPSVIPSAHFSFQTEPGCLCITGISLRFYEKTFLGDTYINDKIFNPTAILNAVLLPGEVDELKTKKWDSMSFKTS